MTSIHADFLNDCKKLMPQKVFSFVSKHEWNCTKDRTKAVYSCSLEDIEMIGDGLEDCKNWIDGAIGWAEYIQDFGEYDTKEEFFHGTDEEWNFEVKKSNEWIGLLKEWRSNL